MLLFNRILGIGACDEAGVIGKNGRLPWRSPEDLKHFFDTICEAPVIMGRKTFLSMPSRYFEKRTAIIFTRCSSQFNSSRNLIFISSLKEFFSIDRQFHDLYVIGGAQIYSLFLKENLIQEFLLTRIKNLHEGDTFFPLSLLEGWRCCKIRETNALSIHRYDRPLA